MSDVPLLTISRPALDALSKVRVLYTDLDGTLVAHGGCVLADADGQPSTAVAEAIVELNRAGLTVVPVSGRERDQLFELTRLLGWRDFIAEAGAVLVSGDGRRGDATYNNGVWEPSALQGRTPYEVIRDSGAVERLMEAFPGAIEPYSIPERPRESTHLLRGCIDADAARALLADIEPPIELVDNGALRGRGSLTCEGTPHAFHLVPAGVSKAQAIAADLAARGLTAEQAAAIGDAATDIEMADSVGVMVLVANAFESPGVIAKLAEKPRANVWRTAGSRGDGWAEFARAWAKARGHRPRHRMHPVVLAVIIAVTTCSIVVCAPVVWAVATITRAEYLDARLLDEELLMLRDLRRPSAETLVGTWKAGDFSMTFRPDGTYEARAMSWMLGPGYPEGTWKLTADGVLLRGEGDNVQLVPIDQQTTDELSFYFRGSVATVLQRQP